MSTQASPLFSVIVAVYNGGATLQRCIDSVAAQNFHDKELIIIDGGSTDDTIDIIRDNEDAIASAVSEPDDGIYHAWNKAVARARGEWLLFLGADDYLWDPHVLSTMACQLVRIPPTVRVVYGRVVYQSIRGESLYTQGEPWIVAKRRFNQLMSLPHQGVFHNASLFREHGTFDQSFRIAGDYEFLLRELKDRDAIFLPIEIAAMGQGGLSSDRTHSMTILRELRRAQRSHGLGWPGPYWVMALLRVQLRRLLWSFVGERHARRMLDYGRAIMGQRAHWTKNAR
jgi:glycosyltransferase involved in cell wall biosynthesis